MYAKRSRPEGTVTDFNEIKRGDKFYYVIGSCNGDVHAIEVDSDLIKDENNENAYYRTIGLDVETLKPEIDEYTNKPIKGEHFVDDRNLDPLKEDCDRYNDNYFFRNREDAEKARDFFRSSYEREYY
ncbi:hypothetical protein PP938_gp066 [Rhizobium phage AF3]|uniref:Uncharacterized protein n=1 Tax=Rhizobium phage AF3 TaxID=2763529 RepID=A0A7G7WW95_9CAUD|nr:hypothetical protein PP938_gp066 [Rhizobium phage AF3]QNH71489.1 hypothetical protein AF3_066 [Rhizobium phage AF3]